MPTETTDHDQPITTVIVVGSGVQHDTRLRAIHVPGSIPDFTEDAVRIHQWLLSAIPATTYTRLAALLKRPAHPGQPASHHAKRVPIDGPNPGHTWVAAPDDEEDD